MDAHAEHCAYDALTDAQKEQVTNADVLTAAEARYTDVVAIDGAEKAIDAIGEVTLASEEAIAAARAAYGALTEARQAEVKSYDKLTAAEARLADLKAAKPVDDMIDAIGEVTLESEDAIAAAYQDRRFQLCYVQRCLWSARRKWRWQNNADAHDLHGAESDERRNSI